MSNRFVVGFVDVLQNGKRSDFTDDPGEQPVHFLGVVAEEEELVAKLGIPPMGRFTIIIYNMPFSAICKGTTEIYLYETLWIVEY